MALNLLMMVYGYVSLMLHHSFVSVEPWANFLPVRPSPLGELQALIPQGHEGRQEGHRRQASHGEARRRLQVTLSL